MFAFSHSTQQFASNHLPQRAFSATAISYSSSYNSDSEINLTIWSAPLLPAPSAARCKRMASAKILAVAWLHTSCVSNFAMANIRAFVPWKHVCLCKLWAAHLLSVFCIVPCFIILASSSYVVVCSVYVRAFMPYAATLRPASALAADATTAAPSFLHRNYHAHSFHHHLPHGHNIHLIVSFHRRIHW